jgi:hypothetical protein
MPNPHRHSVPRIARTIDPFGGVHDALGPQQPAAPAGKKQVRSGEPPSDVEWMME